MKIIMLYINTSILTKAILSKAQNWFGFVVESQTISYQLKPRTICLLNTKICQIKLQLVYFDNYIIVLSFPVKLLIKI